MLGITKAQQLNKKRINKKPSMKNIKKVTDKKVSKEELQKRRLFLLDKKVCQVCDESEDLDHPHHSLFGTAKKDDRSMINICVDCHRHIHTKGFPIHGLSREDTVAIGWLNNEEFLNAQ